MVHQDEQEIARDAGKLEDIGDAADDGFFSGCRARRG